MCPIEELNLGNIDEVEESFEILKIHEVLEKISLFLFAFQKLNVKHKVKIRGWALKVSCFSFLCMKLRFFITNYHIGCNMALLLILKLKEISILSEKVESIHAVGRIRAFRAWVKEISYLPSPKLEFLRLAITPPFTVCSNFFPLQSKSLSALNSREMLLKV